MPNVLLRAASESFAPRLASPRLRADTAAVSYRSELPIMLAQDVSADFDRERYGRDVAGLVLVVVLGLVADTHRLFHTYFLPRLGRMVPSISPSSIPRES